MNYSRDVAPVTNLIDVPALLVVTNTNFAPKNVAELIDTMKRDHASAILTAIWSNNGTVSRIAEETGAKAIEVPNMCGGLPGTDTWIGMMDVLHQRLAAVLGGSKGS